MKKDFNMLKEWTVNYLKNKDLFTRNIEKIEGKKDGWDLIIKTKTGDKYCLIQPVIENINEIIKKLDDSFVKLVVFNKKANLNIIIENWSKIIDFPKFSIMFVNPNSELEKKWVIFPYTHNKITEKVSLKRGLKTLFQTVESMK